MKGGYCCKHDSSPQCIDEIKELFDQEQDKYMKDFIGKKMFTQEKFNSFVEFFDFARIQDKELAIYYQHHLFKHMQELGFNCNEKQEFLTLLLDNIPNIRIFEENTKNDWDDAKISTEHLIIFSRQAKKGGINRRIRYSGIVYNGIFIFNGNYYSIAFTPIFHMDLQQDYAICLIAIYKIDVKRNDFKKKWPNSLVHKYDHQDNDLLDEIKEEKEKRKAQLEEELKVAREAAREAAREVEALEAAKRESEREKKLKKSKENIELFQEKYNVKRLTREEIEEDKYSSKGKSDKKKSSKKKSSKSGKSSRGGTKKNHKKSKRKY